MNLTLESLDGWGVGLGGRGEAGEGSLKKRRVMEVRGSKSGDNFNEASLVEHLQGGGGGFHQVPEQVQSLYKSWGEWVLFVGAVGAPVVGQGCEKHRERSHHVLTNKTLCSVRMVRGEIFQSADSGKSQDRVVLKEERRTTPRYLSFQGRFHKLRVGGVSCQGVAAAHLFRIFL